jgi:hypothetical protein
VKGIFPNWKPRLENINRLSTILSIENKENTMPINEREWRNLVRKHGRTKAAEMVNQKIQQSHEYKEWVKKMNDKHGDNKDV